MRKKLLLLSFRSGLLCLFLFLSASIAGAQVKKIAVLETVDKEGNVPYAVKVMVRSNLTTAITNTPGYEAYDRIDVSQIMGEQSFQRSGLVSDEQIKRLGEIAGVESILIAEAVIFDQTSIFVTAKVLNVETAKTELSENGLMAMTAADIQHGCESLAKKLLGISVGTPPSSTRPSAKPKNPSSAAPKASPSQKPVTISSQVRPDFVDLGLSVKWATFNLGASSPEDAGLLYAWGEIKPKELFGWDTYKWASLTPSFPFPIINLNKYNNNPKKGHADDLNALEVNDDVAAVQYGGSCHIPTEEEWKELISYCKWEWTSLNGVKGYKVSNMENGVSIFLPAVQSVIGKSSQKIINFGFCFWSSSLSPKEPLSAMTLKIEKNGFMISPAFRCTGVPIRPVSEY